MLYGLFELPVWGYVLIALGLTHVTIVSVTIYLHRHQAHRGMDLHPVVAHFFRFWLWLTTGMVTSEWVAVHRKHHAKVETADDPHSPQVRGLHEVLWRGAELYKAAASDPETVTAYGHGTPNDWIERNIYRPHSYLGLVLMLLIDLLCFGVIGLTIWAVQMLWIPFWAAGVINGVGHALGYRNFEPPDASTNIFPLGVLIGGEELHNNHHAFPSSAKFAIKPWEFDIGWMYIRLLQRLGLARVKRVAPRPAIRNKSEVDMETVTAVVRARVHVLAIYARQVLLPTLREELQRADTSCQRLLKRGRWAMLREQSLLDRRDEARLEDALAQSQRLKTVYHFRLRLQRLWSGSNLSHEALLKGLRDWCAQAEVSGIHALQEFARGLRGFTVVQPTPR
ncbi:MAG TPA: fatty acid desaturase [Nitrococcus sp.]|nr:fatty acid desaturase [Nitrococcus sp.]